MTEGALNARHGRVRAELSLRDERPLPGRQGEGAEVLVGYLTLLSSLLPAFQQQTYPHQSLVFLYGIQIKIEIPSLTFEASHRPAPHGLPGPTSAHPECSAQ